MKSFQFSIIFVTVLLTSVPAALTATVTTQLAGVLLLNSGSYFYGNDVKLRSDVVSSGGAMMSWVDVNTALPAGYLSRYFLHTGGLTNGDPATPLRLQIWRPVDIVGGMYTLVWEYRVTVPYMFSRQGLLLQVAFNTSEQFHVMAGDRIGWTCEQDECYLCFDELDDTLISASTSLPNVNMNPTLTFQFDPNGLYGLFSVAVEVIPEPAVVGSPGLPGPRGATGPAGAAGRIGPPGPQGDTGTGEMGPTGPRGLRGGTGFPGPQGEPGVAGYNGTEGPMGPQGALGPPGPQGMQGVQGERGDQGIQGSASGGEVSDPRLTSAIIGIVVPFGVITILLVLAVIFLLCHMRREPADQEMPLKNSNLNRSTENVLPPSHFSNQSYDAGQYDNQKNTFVMKDKDHNTFRSINNLKPMEYLNNDDNLDV